MATFPCKSNKEDEKLEMCQYDTDAPAQGHPHQPRAILTHVQAFYKKWSWKKGHNSHNNWQILP